MPMTASPAGSPEGAMGVPCWEDRSPSARRQAASRQTSASRDSSSVVTVRSASPRRSRLPIRRRGRYLKRRRTFQRAGEREEGGKEGGVTAKSFGEELAAAAERRQEVGGSRMGDQRRQKGRPLQDRAE